MHLTSAPPLPTRLGCRWPHPACVPVCVQLCLCSMPRTCWLIFQHTMSSLMAEQLLHEFLQFSQVYRTQQVLNKCGINQINCILSVTPLETLRIPLYLSANPTFPKRLNSCPSFLRLFPSTHPDYSDGHPCSLCLLQHLQAMSLILAWYIGYF